MSFLSNEALSITKELRANVQHILLRSEESCQLISFSFIRKINSHLIEERSKPDLLVLRMMIIWQSPPSAMIVYIIFLHFSLFICLFSPFLYVVEVKQLFSDNNNNLGNNGDRTSSNNNKQRYLALISNNDCPQELA